MPFRLLVRLVRFGLQFEESRLGDWHCLVVFGRHRGILQCWLLRMIDRFKCGMLECIFTELNLVVAMFDRVPRFQMFAETRAGGI